MLNVIFVNIVTNLPEKAENGVFIAFDVDFLAYRTNGRHDVVCICVFLLITDFDDFIRKYPKSP